MADTPEHDAEPVADEVTWYRDPDGTEWFVDDGVRFELADDGFAYPVVGGSTDTSGAERLDVVVEEAPDATDEASWPEEVEDADDTDDADGEATEDGAGSPFAPGAASDADEPAAQDAPAPVVQVGSTQVVEDEDAPAQDHRHDGLAVEPLLSITQLDAGYGSLPVLKHVDLQIRPGETAVLLGLNGAGKTTTAWTVCGALAPWAGQITYDGQDVTGWSTRTAVNNGVVMVPEGRRVFPELSVGRNLQVGAWARRSDSEWIHAQRERVFNYFPRLREREKQMAGTLSGGEQQMLAVGRGLMADPRLLIIDEASMGLAPVIVKDVFDIVAQINEDGVTVMMIEQNVGVLEVADVGYVMEQGRIIKVLEGEDLRDRSVVSAALMG